jgi:putative transposase
MFLTRSRAFTAWLAPVRVPTRENQFGYRTMRRLKNFDYSNKAVYITTDTYKQRSIFISDDKVNRIYEALDEVYPKYDFKINEFVIMPTHCHFIIVSQNNDLSDIMHDIKGTTAFEMLDSNLIEDKLWQRGFYDHVIRNKNDLIEKLNYIHQNPIRAGLVKDISDYKHSGFKLYYDSKCEIRAWFAKI